MASAQSLLGESPQLRDWLTHNVGPYSGTARFVGGDNPDYSTVQSAVTSAKSGDTIFVAPGSYDEEVTVPFAKTKLTIVGLGGRGATFIAPTDDDTTALTVHADDVTIVNLGCDGEGTGAGAVVTGARFRAYASKFEGGAAGAKIGPGAAADVDTTAGDGADGLFDDCEFAWTTDGLVIDASDYGAVTQLAVRRSKFHNCTNAINEAPTTAALSFQNLEVSDCTFDDNDEGTAPTAFILLNDDNANNGIVTGCRFPSATNSGKNLVSTALHWVSNFHTGGISTGQPS